MRTEVGGSGAGSTFTWQEFPTIGLNSGARASTEMGCRWLDTDDASGADGTHVAWDVLTQGPVPGVGFKF